ncbi:MAG: sensor histidine kinase [Propionibacteriaceae bacterium]
MTRVRQVLARWFSSIGARVAVPMVLVVLASAAATAWLGVYLLQQTDDVASRKALATLADVYQAETNAGVSPDAAETALGVANVKRALITPTGKLTGDGLARLSLTPAEVQQVVGGKAVSTRARVGGAVVFVEARPTASGGLILAQRRVDASGRISAEVLPRWYLAVGGIALTAALLGLLVAWRVTRPLRRLADAATALAAGDREPVPAVGPTEVRALAARLNDLSAGLGHAEARQREFLMSVSHDLRTPLATVMGYAESLAAGDVPAADVADVGAVLHAESMRLARMVSDLLDLARLDADELSIQVREIDLATEVADVYAAWSDRAARHGVTLSLTGERHPVPVMADAQRLRQAVDGLLDNALRVTPSVGRIVLDLTVADSTATVAVRDTGPGLTDDDLSVAFDRGTLHERYRGRRHVGTGLGLALVDRLISRQGGTVSAAHAPEGGASFAISLPLHDPGLTKP